MIPHRTRAAEGFDRRGFTVADIFRMIEAGVISEDENFELIDGEIVPMSPKGNHHEVIKAALNERFATNKPRELRLAIETSVYFSDRTFIEPDLTLYPRAILPVDVRGPDILLAVEVSASSLGYDKGLKAKLYARYGVREFWVVDAERRAAFIHTGPRGDGGWASIVERGPDEALTTVALPGLSIVLARLD